MSVAPGQVYRDLAATGRLHGRRMVVESLTGGLPADPETYAVIRSEDGHPSRTGVVSVRRLAGPGYALAEGVGT